MCLFITAKKIYARVAKWKHLTKIQSNFLSKDFFLVGIVKALRILSCWGHLVLQLVQNRVTPSHRPISTEQLIPFGALATTSYWVCVNAWLEKWSKMPPMVTAPHHYTVGAKITCILASRPRGKTNSSMLARKKWVLGQDRGGNAALRRGRDI